jgi:hypothetical protein
LNKPKIEYRTIEQIVSRDKRGMIIISSQIGLHENVVALDYEREYANLIVNHNLSYETVTLDEGGKRVVVQEQPNKQKGLLPTIVEQFLKRRLHFKRMLKQLPKESIEYVWCEQRVNSLKNILVCLYGSTGSLWNRCGNVLVFEEREDDKNSEVWKPVTNGLPEPSGTIISVLAANPNVAAELYAINNCGIFCSTDSGNSWKMLDGIAWPKHYLSQHPRALAVREN